MSAQHILARNRYVARLVPVTVSTPSRPVVYIDESFVHHHYSRHQDSLYDPTDLTEVDKKKHKGRRLCFIAGVMVSTESVNGRIYGLDIFEGGQKAGKTIKDYHSMFNHVYFINWWDRLLDEFESYGFRAVTFVVGNAAYHKGKPDGTPKGTWSKELLYLTCLEYGIPFSPYDLRSTLWAQVKSYVKLNVEPLVVKMANDRGHSVVYTAPGHSELQPIETVLALAKKEVGRQYDSNTTFELVRERLDMAFAALTPTAIDNHIAHSTKLLHELHDKLNAEDSDGSCLSEGSSTDGVESDSGSICSSGCD